MNDVVLVVAIIASCIGAVAIGLILILACVVACLLCIGEGGFVVLFLVSIWDLYETGECCIPLPGGRGQTDLRYAVKDRVKGGTFIPSWDH
jgi:hypothetical protein